MGKAASSVETEAFDLHFLPYSPTHRGDEKRWSIGTSALLPRSRGFVRIRSTDPEAKPIIDHRFLTDPEGLDVAMLIDGAEILRDLAATPALARSWPRDPPGPDTFTREALAAHLYAHPTTTGIRSARAGWASTATRSRSSTPAAGCTAWTACGSRTAPSCPACPAPRPPCPLSSWGRTSPEC